MTRVTCAALTFLLFVLPLHGESTPADRSTITGVVSTVSGSFITILEGWVTIDATGAVFAGRRGEASIADVKPGMRVTAVLSGDRAGATLRAVHIHLLEEPAGSIRGRVDSVDIAGRTITVLGMKIAVTDSTRIGGNQPRNELTPAGIKPGDLVLVVVSSSSSGLVAEQIVVETLLRPSNVAGTVKSISADRWIVTTREGHDVTVIVNAQTRIEGSPRPGDLVVATGQFDGDRNLVATLIVTAPPPPQLIEGVVQSQGSGSWTIRTRDRVVTVLVNAQTRIDGAPAVNDPVRVVAAADRDGNLVALHITKVQSPPAPNLGRFEGVVGAIGREEWLVGDVRVLVTPATRIVGAPQVGDTVRVTGARARDGAFLAILVEKK